MKKLKENLDEAVLKAYGFDTNKDLLEQILNLNFEVAENEDKKIEVQKAGLPNFIADKSPYVFADECIKA